MLQYARTCPCKTFAQNFLTCGCRTCLLKTACYATNFNRHMLLFDWLTTLVYCDWATVFFPMGAVVATLCYTIMTVVFAWCVSVSNDGNSDDDDNH